MILHNGSVYTVLPLPSIEHIAADFQHYVPQSYNVSNGQKVHNSTKTGDIINVYNITKNENYKYISNVNTPTVDLASLQGH